MLARLGLRLRVLLIFAGLAGAVLAALVAGMMLAYARLGDPALLNAVLQGGLVAGFAVLGLVTWVWYLFDLNVARPVILLASALRARAHSDVTAGIDARLAQYLGDLAPAADAAARSLSETRNALAEAVARETSRLTAEKQRLEALLADVPVGVVLCSGEHQLAFYNGVAVDLLGAEGAPGLGRGLFDYLREGPIRMAYGRLLAAGDMAAASDLLCASVRGARVLAGRMRLVETEAGAAAGYVLILRDVTADLGALARREALLAEMLDRVRRPAANLSTLLAALPEGDAVPGRLDHALRDEVASLVTVVTDLARQREVRGVEDWPLASVRAADLADGLRARIEAEGLAVTAVETDPLLLRCNGFEVIALLSGLARRLAAAVAATGFRIAVTEEDGGAAIRLYWSGAPLAVKLLADWLDEPVEAGGPDVTGQAVLAAHRTELWPEAAGGGYALCLPIPQARRDVGRPAPAVRAVVYDFDLLGKVRNEALAEARLEDLTYVVFDTETTGLLPAQGDEIVQIAALRIVNGRRVAGEVFDMLVNPGRTIPAGATAVHGITDQMVADAVSVDEALRRFHAFAQGAVLVAHNAPFDMQFLRRREAGLGLRFDMPILDTVLLSAVLYGQHDVHSLDALCHRLGIVIPDEARHTAIGDTLATADALLKMLPMLRGRGHDTFRAVLAEVRRHGRLLADLNEPLG